MAPIPTSRPAGAVGHTLVQFALHGTFPEEDVSSIRISPDELASALLALNEAKTKLEADIKIINGETYHEVNTWLENAKSLEGDVKQSRRMADDIEADAHAPQVSGETIWEAKHRVEFLAREMNFKEILHHTLESIATVNQLLDQAEKKRNERRILDSLHLLEDSKSAMDNVSVSRTCRAMKLLDVRIFDLTTDVHRVFDHVWNTLVDVNVEGNAITILEQHPDEPMQMADACKGIISYNEADTRMGQLWHDVDRLILRPRMDVEAAAMRKISVDEDGSTLSLLEESTHESAAVLLDEVEMVCQYLSKRLPDEFMVSLSEVMMPDLCSRIIAEWLDPAVPSSLQDMDTFEAIVAKANTLSNSLEACNYSYDSFRELRDWGQNAPKVWLTKCRETALDAVRSKLAGGLGATKEVERVETQKVTRLEGNKLVAASGMQVDDGWDATWSDEEQGTKTASAPDQPGEEDLDIPMPDDDAADAWGWGDNDGDNTQTTGEKGEKDEKDDKDDKGDNNTTTDKPMREEEKYPNPDDNKDNNSNNDEESDAWGWGEDGGAEPDISIEEPPQITAKNTSSKSPLPPPQQPAEAETRDITLKESYLISSIPDPILSIISSLLSDGALLLDSPSHSDSPVLAAAPGLFSLPTLILAIFRAIGPYYYSLSPAGPMLLYNDSSYLSFALQSLATNWRAREDVSKRVKSLLRLEGDAAALLSFAARAYGNELATQKTVLRDLLGRGGAGGTDNFLLDPCPSEADLGPAMAHIRAVAEAWKSVLPRGTWLQALGSLMDEAAASLIADVLDMPAIGQDDAFAIAALIESLFELDDLFSSSQSSSSSGPMTSGHDVDRSGMGTGAGKSGDNIMTETVVPTTTNDEEDDDGDDDAWGWGGEETPANDPTVLPPPTTTTTTTTTTNQFAPTQWLRLKYLSQFLQSNLIEIRYMWFSTDLSLHFSAHDVVDLIGLSFEQNVRTKAVVRDVRDTPHPLPPLPTTTN